MKWKNFTVSMIAVCLVQIASGQNDDKKSDKMITITGKVLNQDKKPVEGAVFYIDNIKTSCVSRSNGSYKIKVSPSSLNLEVRSAGYEFSKTVINGETTINFTLKSVDRPTDTLKVNEMTGTDKKSSRNRAKKLNTYNNIYQMIRAEVSGVIVNGNSVQIEQGHSFFGSSTPLFVINGVIVPSIDNVNPLEVKSITVLKGVSASIYGVNGTNGVISITLNNGSEKEK